MISAGKNIIDAKEPLMKVKVEYLVNSLKKPKPAIFSRISQLRIIRNIDAKQYASLKRQLPFVVCGIFNPPHRKTENFAYTEYFILDIDHIYDKGLNMTQIRHSIENDPQVLLSFLSPGEDGLKVMFKLSQRCYDEGIYSLFYKAFLKNFSTRHGLDQVIDSKTSDVCRACFISVDNNVYYNPAAQLIDINSYIPHDDVNALFELKSTLIKEEKLSAAKEEPKRDVDPSDEVIDRVKALLNPNATKPAKNIPYIPQQLDEIIEQLKHYIESTGIMVYDIINIQYGKKIRMKMGFKEAEINLFYGKNGFSVVKSPRCGTSVQLNEMMAQLVNSFIYNLTATL